MNEWKTLNCNLLEIESLNCKLLKVEKDSFINYEWMKTSNLFEDD